MQALQREKNNGIVFRVGAVKSPNIANVSLRFLLATALIWSLGRIKAEFFQLKCNEKNDVADDFRCFVCYLHEVVDASDFS